MVALTAYIVSNKFHRFLANTNFHTLGIVQRADNDLQIFGMLTHKTKQNIEACQSFDGNPIYAILHEAIYCQGYSM